MKIIEIIFWSLAVIIVYTYLGYGIVLFVMIKIKRLFSKKVTINIFNTYGSRMNPDDGRVVSNFIVQALKGQDITIFGNGEQTRSFQYVDDLLEGMTRMMKTDDSVIGPVNIGNPNEFTMLELATKVIDLTGSKSKLIFQELPSDDPKQRQPNIDKARQILGGWNPNIQLNEGLIKTIQYFEKELCLGK